MCLNIDLYYTEAALGFTFLKGLKTGKHIKYRLFHFTLLFRLLIYVAATDARHTLANPRTMNSFNIYHTLVLTSVPWCSAWAKSECGKCESYKKLCLLHIKLNDLVTLSPLTPYLHPTTLSVCFHVDLFLSLFPGWFGTSHIHTCEQHTKQSAFL